MADNFVFSNFAVAALQSSITQFDTTAYIDSDDVSRFPILVGGAKFPIVLADNNDHVEICYATALTISGVMTIERAKEGTAARSWSAGTTVEHTFTAAAILAAIGLNPKGTWSAATNYVARDVVVHNDISYMATQASLNQVPSAVSAYWQSFYVPPGVSSSALTRQGDWNSGTTYAIGALVKYNGRLWASLSAGNTNHLPTDPAWWTALTVTADPVWYETYLTASGTNNYTVSPSPAPAALYDGMTLDVMFTNANTAAATLVVGALAPVPLRPKKGVEFASGEIIVNSGYKFTYLSGSGELVAQSAPVFEKKIGDMLSRIAAVESFVSNFIGVIADYGSVSVPAGWVECSGQAISRTTYALLFAKIGTTFGAGDGSTTFNVPDSRERVLVGRSSGSPGGIANRITSYFVTPTLAGVGGDQNLHQHTHSVTDPGHNHNVTDPGHFHTGTQFQDNGGFGAASGVFGTAQIGGDNIGSNTDTKTTGISLVANSTGISIQNAGSGTWGNLQPFLITTKMIYAGA